MHTDPEGMETGGVTVSLNKVVATASEVAFNHHT